MKLAVLKIKTVGFAMLLFMSLAAPGLVITQMASAQSPDAVEERVRQCQANGGTWDGTTGQCTQVPIADGEGRVYAVKNDCNGPNISASVTDPEDENYCGILRYLIVVINVLSALVAIAVVGSIIYGGIQYSSAGSDPQKIAAAKDRIRNALIAMFFFIFMYGLLNYLVPGGVLQ